MRQQTGKKGWERKTGRCFFKNPFTSRFNNEDQEGERKAFLLR